MAPNFLRLSKVVEANAFLDGFVMNLDSQVLRVVTVASLLVQGQLRGLENFGRR